MSVFLKATQSEWYREFLGPVADSVLANPENKRILDIGTGPGTLPQILIGKDSGLQITGIDSSQSMIDEARRNVSAQHVTFQYQPANKPLPFADREFDVVAFCSVLFLLGDSVRTILLNEAIRVLKPGGKVIILTPSGRKPILSSLIEMWRYKFSFNNFTFPIWKLATTHRARKWQGQKWPEQYAKRNQLGHAKAHVFNGNATLEVISKHL